MSEPIDLDVIEARTQAAVFSATTCSHGDRSQALFDCLVLISAIRQRDERIADTEKNNLDLQDDLVRVMEQRNRLERLVKMHPFCSRCGKCDDMEIAEDAHYDVSQGHTHTRCMTAAELEEIENL